MKTMRLSCTAAAAVLMSGVALSASATTCNPGEACDITTTSRTTSTVHNSTSNFVYTGFSKESQEAGLRLKSVYTAVESLNQKNTGKVSVSGNHQHVITTGKGEAEIEVVGIGNNLSAELVGIRSANLSVNQQNHGAITASTAVINPRVGGDLVISTTAIGNNASVGWDLTTDKNRGTGNFDTKRDGPLLGFDKVGTLVGSVAQCNTAAVQAHTHYTQDPAARIKVSTTAIGNNFTFGVKTR